MSDLSQAIAKALEPILPKSARFIGILETEEGGLQIVRNIPADEARDLLHEALTGNVIDTEEHP